LSFDDVLVEEKYLLHYSTKYSLFSPKSWHQAAGVARSPDYELLMRVYTDLYGFVSVCTSLFCNRIIVKDFMVLHPFGGNTGTKTGTN
jgi:hypothetical protein